jgi:hypothetical protein
LEAFLLADCEQGASRRDRKRSCEAYRPIEDRACAAEYPIDEIKLPEWRANQDVFRGDIERLEFLLKSFPNNVTPRTFQNASTAGVGQNLPTYPSARRSSGMLPVTLAN